MISSLYQQSFYNMKWGKHGLNYRNKIIAALLTVVITLSSMPFMAKAERKTTGTYQCDWFDESLYYPYEYDDEWFSGSSFEYNHQLALLALNISMATFNSFNTGDRDEHIRTMLQNCGYETKAYGYETEGYDTAAVEMAKKTVRVSDGEYTVVIAAIRSGNYGMEWGGNLRVGKGENHLGFDLGKEIVLNYINDYFSALDIKGRVKLLIPGYSRGGSIANLVGGELDDGSYEKSLHRANSIKKLNAGNALKTLGVILSAVALGIIPTNIDTIKSDGFRSYIADQIVQSDASRNLTKPQIQSIIDVITALLEFAKNNRSDVKALLGQLNTVLNVHQPYVTLSWMRSINQNDILKINGKSEKPLRVSFNKIDLRYKANARIIAEYDETLGTLVWRSDSENIVGVDKNGFITAKGDGEAIVTVKLCSADGKVIDSEKVRVTVHMNTFEVIITTVKNIFEKAAV